MTGAISEIGRGNLITWTQSFLDAEGNAVTPTSATLYVSAKRACTVAIPMTLNSDNSYSASWDSSQAHPGLVNWCIKSVGPASAKDGCLLLTANAANCAAEVTQ